MKFNTNPYYSPEKCGLEILEFIDTAGSYEFDMLVVWKKLDDGTLWWDADSGCSCPIPFDTGRHELMPITPDTFYNFDEALKNLYNIKKEEYNSFKLKIKKYLDGKN
jgi:hypothetical protein